jgi:Ca2+-binding EF-hand superfamily protein
LPVDWVNLRRSKDVSSIVRILIFIVFSMALLAQRDHDEDGRRGGPGDMTFIRVSPVMAGLDANHDGEVTRQEWAAAPKVLKSLDKNGDGKVSLEEMAPRLGPGRAGFRGRGGRGPGGPPEGGPRGNPGEMVDTLMAFDKNSDGVLAKEEVPERMQGVFVRGDVNKDGKLTRDELAKLAAGGQAQQGGEGRGGRGERPGGPPRDTVMTALDADKDGMINAAEMAAAPAALAKLDRNKDGKLTDEEVRPFGPPPGGPGGPGGRGRGNAGEMAGRMFEEWDTNGDGKVTKAEMPERMRERFTEGDTNKDGWISRGELTALLQSGMAGGRR